MGDIYAAKMGSKILSIRLWDQEAERAFVKVSITCGGVG